MKIQIDDTVRDATPNEIAALEALRADDEAIIAAAEAKSAALSSARGKLASLGLTETEIKALVG